ncbi:MAG: hypothetical protein ACI8QZ_002713 [Chlamydiales bacterium]|jgi:hypothetical protein
MGGGKAYLPGDMAEGARSGKWRRWIGRSVALLIVLAAVLIVTLPLWVRALGGASAWTLVDDPEGLSPGARALLEETLADLDPALTFDFHTHLAGIGDGSDCWVNPRLRSWWHPMEHLRFLIYLSAAGVDRDANPADAQTAPAAAGLDILFVDQLVRLAGALPGHGRHLLLAFDHRHDEQGRVDLEHSEFFVSNEAMWAAVGRAPELFVPCISVHPYRDDALAELGRWADQGVRFVKWLPNAMGIDPASERCDAFFELMVERDMVLITHTGLERAVDAEEDQELGNPLRLRRALGHGLKVIAAHCASSGDGDDLDRPGQRVPNFDLFMRLMDEPASQGLLFGDISTVTQVNRFGSALEALLLRPDLHRRLVNGSDWPLPGINALYSTWLLRRAGFLTEAESAHLAELYDYSPLVFDLALKRTVHAPGTTQRFGASVFEAPQALLP